MSRVPFDLRRPAFVTFDEQPDAGALLPTPGCPIRLVSTIPLPEQHGEILILSRDLRSP